MNQVCVQQVPSLHKIFLLIYLFNCTKTTSQMEPNGPAVSYLPWYSYVVDPSSIPDTDTYSISEPSPSGGTHRDHNPLSPSITCYFPSHFSVFFYRHTLPLFEFALVSRVSFPITFYENFIQSTCSFKYELFVNIDLLLFFVVKLNYL